jgi:hypothetical protein
MASIVMPAEVPALTADKIVRNMEQSGSRRCLSGWLDYVFGANGQARSAARKAICAQIGKSLKKKVAVNDGTLIEFNDDKDAGRKLSAIAGVWNRAMHDLGFGTAKFTLKKSSKFTSKKTSKKSK